MPYTQAHPFDDSVNKSLKQKVDLLKARESEGEGYQEATYYFNARAPWIRMTSSVGVTDGNLRSKFGTSTEAELAKDYVLGTLDETTGFAGHKMDDAYQVQDSYGIRPQPGIQNMSIVSHNQFGSLRTATVNFQVYTKKDLDACEILFMRPGMSVLLEWGWSLYVDPDTGGIKNMKKGIDVLGRTNVGFRTVLAEIRAKQKECGYGYDALFGFVKNFKWTLRADGGYDCTTSLVSAGELVESINLARPLADKWAEIYKATLGRYTSILKTAAIEAATVDSETVYYGYDAFVSTPTKIDTSNEMYQELMSQLGNVPSIDTQTYLSAFINYDVNRFATHILKPKDKENVPLINSITLGELSTNPSFTGFDSLSEDGTTTPYFIPISTNIAQQNLGEQHTITQVNWRNPEYQTTTDGKLKLEDGREVIVEEVFPQTYIKYGTLLFILNNFMLQQDNKVMTPFETEKSGKFSVFPGYTLSIDPSVCLLPADLEVLKETANIASSEQVEPYITDIQINTLLLEDLINSSGLANVSKQGTPMVGLYNFLDNLNTKINEACGGIIDLDVQYYEHEGLFGVIDRKTFSSQTKKFTSLDLVGLGSLMHNINVTSSLTPDMSSHIAISVQTDIAHADSESRGFLRFNKGIKDRIIGRRSLVSEVIKPEEGYTNNDPEATFSEINTLYSVIYGNAFWAEASFPYAKAKFVEYINKAMGRGEDGNPVGQVVIPFMTNLTLDGMSGLRILNGFTIKENLLPYKYGDVVGKVGLVITGLQATVDKSGWKSQIKAQYYNLTAGKPVEKGLEVQEGYDLTDTGGVGDNYVYDYSNELFELGDDSLDLYLTRVSPGGSSDSLMVVKGNYDSGDIKRMQRKIWHHYEDFWGKGTVNENDDMKKAVGSDQKFFTDERGDAQIFDPELTSALQLYWVNYLKGYGDTFIWQNSQDYPWSAVYVSYMMGKIDLHGKQGMLLGQLRQGYGASSSEFKKASSHYGYATQALEARKSKAKGKWVAFSLKETLKATSGQILPIEILAEPGDILISARRGKYVNSHGAIVHDVGPRSALSATEIGTDALQTLDEGQIVLAGGNESNTNKVEVYSDVVSSEGYYKAVDGVLQIGSFSFMLVLKRM